MNTRSKGRQSELEFKKILENKGEIVYLVKMPSKFSLSQDIFGLFDGFSINKLSKQKTFFQVKTNNHQKIETLSVPFITFRNKFLRQEDKIILAIKFNKTGWKEVEI